MGVMFLAHDALKLFVFGPAGTVRYFGSLGLPPALAYVAMALELVGGIALILGVWTRVVALVLIPHLLATIWFVHGALGWQFSAPGGGWEFPAFWAAALLGGEFPEEKKSAEDLTPAALLARFEKADGDFLRALAEVRSRGGWDDTFIDALCEPAETFTFGGMFAHVITFNTYRRLSALGMLRDLGVKVEGFGCPTEYEMAVAPWRPVEVAR